MALREVFMLLCWQNLLEICPWGARGTIHGEVSCFRICPKAMGENARGICSQDSALRATTPREAAPGVPRELLAAGNHWS